MCAVYSIHVQCGLMICTINDYVVYILLLLLTYDMHGTTTNCPMRHTPLYILKYVCACICMCIVRVSPFIVMTKARLTFCSTTIFGEHAQMRKKILIQRF